MVDERIERPRDVVEEIVRSGLSEYHIADEVGASQASINRIRNGKQVPGDLLGQKLRRLRDTRRGQETTA